MRPCSATGLYSSLVYDGSQELQAFRRKCYSEYRLAGEQVAWIQVVLIGMFALIYPLDQGWWNYFGTLPLGAALIWIILKITRGWLDDAEQKYLRVLTRHIRTNLFDKGLWLDVLESPPESVELLGIDLTVSPVQKFEDKLDKLYWEYPKLCENHKLKAFPIEFSDFLASVGSRQKGQYQLLWRVGLADALLKEFARWSPQTQKQKTETKPPTQSAARSSHRFHR